MSQGGIINIAGGGGGGSPVLSLTGDSGGAVFPTANNINVIGGPGIQVSGAGSTLTINNTGAGFNWNVVTNATNPNSLVKENGYIPKGGVAVQFLLPATAAVGDTFRISGYGNLWTLTQNALQTITLGIVTTTAGIGGSITATNARDTIELVCVAANLEFQIQNGIGNLTFV